MDGGYAYLLVWDVGLVVIDIHDPTAPQVVAIRPEPVRPSGIVLSGHHAYVSDMGLGLCVVDILDPTQPQLAATHALPGELRNLDFEDGVVFVAGDFSDLHILDVSTPSAPALITTVDLAGQVREVAVRNGLAYLACGFNGLRIFDVKNPTAPQQIAQKSMVFDLGFSVWTRSVSLAGDHACVGLNSYGLGLVDISDPTAPVDVVRQEIRGTTSAMAILNDRAYVSASHGGLVVVDIGIPAVPLVTSQFWTLGMVTDLEAADGKAWVAGGYSPTDEKSLPNEKSQRTHDAGLFVVDMTETSSPRVIGYGSTGLEPSHLALSGQYAYLSNEFGGIRIQDISDPTNPTEVGFMPTTTAGYAHDVDGDHAYTFAGSRFVVMEVSDPSLPVEVGSIEVDYHGHLTVKDGVAYSTIDHQGLQVFDVGDPAHPAAIAWLDLPSGAQQSALSGDHLFVANGPNGLTVVDVSSPSQPVVVGSCDLPGYVVDVACRWPFAYLAANEFMDESSHLLVVDISNPVAPVHVDGTDLPTVVWAVAVDGSLVYVGCHWKGVMVFRHDATSGVMIPSPSTRLWNHPNPFNPQTLITFEIPASTHVSISVYDVAGRLVRSLVDEMKTFGSHEVPWDGRDNGGTAVGTGVYFYRMITEQQTTTGKMLLLK